MIEENNEKMSRLSLQIENLNTYISELKSFHIDNSETTKELASHESGLFSIDSSGNRVVNSSETLDRNPTSCIKSRIKSVLSNDLKSKVTTILSEYDTYVTKNGVEIATFGQSNCSTETSKSRSHTNSIPTPINDIIAVLDPDNNQNLNTVVVKRFSRLYCGKLLCR